MRGEEAAQVQLYRLLRNGLISVARLYERDPSHRRSMVNEAFLKILQNLAKRGPDVPFHAWCRRITINTVLNDLRARNRTERHVAPMDHELALALHSSEQNSVEEFIEAEELQNLIDQLPVVTRQVFVLHVVEGYLHREIAELLVISEGTSKWHVSHARSLLRNLLAVMERKLAIPRSA